MATNRDYTGLQCTPSSLAWLIRRRAVAKGKLDRHLKEFERLPVTIAQDQAEIASLDMVISMHEVVVDPQVIKGLRKKSPHLAAYGAMSKAIWECLKLAGDRPVYTTEVAMHFIRRAKLDIDKIGKALIVYRVGSRLKGLCAEGKVRRHHSSAIGSKAEGRWSLPPDDAPSA